MGSTPAPANNAAFVADLETLEVKFGAGRRVLDMIPDNEMDRILDDPETYMRVVARLGCRLTHKLMWREWHKQVQAHNKILRNEKVYESLITLLVMCSLTGTMSMWGIGDFLLGAIAFITVLHGDAQIRTIVRTMRNRQRLCERLWAIHRSECQLVHQEQCMDLSGGLTQSRYQPFTFAFCALGLGLIGLVGPDWALKTVLIVFSYRLIKCGPALAALLSSAIRADARNIEYLDAMPINNPTQLWHLFVYALMTAMAGYIISIWLRDASRAKDDAIRGIEKFAADQVARLEAAVTNKADEVKRAVQKDIIEPVKTATAPLKFAKEGIDRAAAAVSTGGITEIALPAALLAGAAYCAYEYNKADAKADSESYEPSHAARARADKQYLHGRLLGQLALAAAPGTIGATASGIARNMKDAGTIIDAFTFHDYRGVPMSQGGGPSRLKDSVTFALPPDPDKAPRPGVDRAFGLGLATGESKRATETPEATIQGATVSAAPERTETRAARPCKSCNVMYVEDECNFCKIGRLTQFTVQSTGAQLDINTFCSEDFQGDTSAQLYARTKMAEIVELVEFKGLIPIYSHAAVRKADQDFVDVGEEGVDWDIDLRNRDGVVEWLLSTRERPIIKLEKHVALDCNNEYQHDEWTPRTPYQCEKCHTYHRSLQSRAKCGEMSVMAKNANAIRNKLSGAAKSVRSKVRAPTVLETALLGAAVYASARMIYSRNERKSPVTQCAHYKGCRLHTATSWNKLCDTKCDGHTCVHFVGCTPKYTISDTPLLPKSESVTDSEKVTALVKLFEQHPLNSKDFRSICAVTAMCEPKSEDKTRNRNKFTNDKGVSYMRFAMGPDNVWYSNDDVDDGAWIDVWWDEGRGDRAHRRVQWARQGTDDLFRGLRKKGVIHVKKADGTNIIMKPYDDDVGETPYEPKQKRERKTDEEGFEEESGHKASRRERAREHQERIREQRREREHEHKGDRKSNTDAPGSQVQSTTPGPVGKCPHCKRTSDGWAVPCAAHKEYKKKKMDDLKQHERWLASTTHKCSCGKDKIIPARGAREGPCNDCFKRLNSLYDRKVCMTLGCGQEVYTHGGRCMTHTSKAVAESKRSPDREVPAFYTHVHAVMATDSRAESKTPTRGPQQKTLCAICGVGCAPHAMRDHILTHGKLGRYDLVESKKQNEEFDRVLREINKLSNETKDKTYPVGECKIRLPSVVDTFLESPTSQALHQSNPAFTTDAILKTFQISVPLKEKDSYAISNGFVYRGAMVATWHGVARAVGPPTFTSPFFATPIVCAPISDHPSGAQKVDGHDIAVWKAPTGMSSIKAGNVKAGDRVMAIRLTSDNQPRFQFSEGPVVSLGEPNHTRDSAGTEWTNQSGALIFARTEASNSGCPYINHAGHVVAMHAGGYNNPAEPAVCVWLNDTVGALIDKALSPKNGKAGGSPPVSDTGPSALTY